MMPVWNGNMSRVLRRGPKYLTNESGDVIMTDEGKKAENPDTKVFGLKG